MNFGLKFSLQFENILLPRSRPIVWPRVGPAGWQNVGERRSLTKCKLDRVTLNTFPNVHKSQMMVIDNVKAAILIWKEVTHGAAPW